MLPEGICIEDLLPHRNGMLLVAQVLELGKDQAVSASTVNLQWPMTDSQGAHPLVLVELAAQTAGIHNGWQIRQEQGPNADHQGWIVGIKSAEFFVDMLPLGTEIIVTANNQFAFEEFREIRARASMGDRPVAEIIMQLMRAKSQ
jgi:predicted hotdog family 3-hydroxylacyl-ACP dehydratase